MKVTKIIELDYGHTLPNHYSYCNQLHGHRARILATIEGDLNDLEENSSEGMILDFGILKKIMMEKIHAVLDHGFAVWKNDKKDLRFIKKRNKKYLLTDMPPTAEVLAEWAFHELATGLYELFPQQIDDRILVLMSVIWYETPNSYAEYP